MKMMKSWQTQHPESVHASCSSLALPEISAEEFRTRFMATQSKYYTLIQHGEKFGQTLLNFLKNGMVPNLAERYHSH